MDFHSLDRRDLQFLCKKNGIPANLTNAAMSKALEDLETVEAIEEIKEALGLQSPRVNSLENFSRGDESKIQKTVGFQNLKEKSLEHPHTGRRTSVRRAATCEESPCHRSHQAAAKDLAFKEEVPVSLPKTPATRNATKGVEAQSTKRRANKSKEVEIHTQTPMAVEAKGGKAVVARRSTRLSSRKALEEMATTQSKSRGGSRENSVVKMVSLAKEDMEEQEGDKKNLVEEHGKKDQEEEKNESKKEVENECLATHEDAIVTQEHQPGLRTRRKKPVDNDEKKESLKPVKEKSRDGEVKMVALTEIDAEEKGNGDEKKGLAEKSDSCVVTTIEEEDEEKDKKEENHRNYSSIEVKNGDSVAALVEEVEISVQKEETHGSSSIEVEISNVEAENGYSTVALVEGGEKNDQEPELQIFSSSIERDYLNLELENDDDEEQSDSSIFGDNSNVEVDESLAFTKESDSQPTAIKYMKDSSDQSPENEIVEVSGDLLPKNEAAEDFEDHDSEVKLVISAVLDNLSCTEMQPFWHEEASACTRGSSEIEDEEDMELSLLFTKMTLKEAEALLEPEVAENVSSVSKKLSASVEESFNDDLSHADAGELANNDSVHVQGDPFEISQVTAEDSYVEFLNEAKESSEIPAVIRKSVEDADLGKVAANFSSFDVPQKTEISEGVSLELLLHGPVSCACSKVDSSVEFKEAHGDFSDSGDQVPVPSTAKLCDATAARTVSAPLKLSRETGMIMSLEEQSVVQTQPSEEADMAATAVAEANEETKTKALEIGKLELLSLTKLRAMYRHIVSSTKPEQQKKSLTKQEDFESLNCIKKDENKENLNDDMIELELKRPVVKQEDLMCLSHGKLDSNCKQKLNDDMIKLEWKRPVLKQEDLMFLSHGKLDSNCKQKLNDDKIKSAERKRTPLKSLN